MSDTRKWLGPFTDGAEALDQLRRSVAEIIGADPDTWPDHGNAPLAIAAAIGLRQAELNRCDAAPPPAADAVTDDEVMQALRRLWPLIERGTKGFVFTAEKAGEVAADMATLRAALAAKETGRD